MNIQNTNNEWIEEELTIAELIERFIGTNDFNTPEVYETNSKLEILGRNLETNEDVYRPIKSIIVKPNVDFHYTDGKLKGTINHNIIENGKEVPIQNHPDFKLVNEPINVVDFEVDDVHNYYANGRLNHNTTPCGMALPFASSVRIRLAGMGKIKKGEEIIGMNAKASVIKTRCGPNFRTAEFEIHYDSGIQNLSSWLDFSKTRGIITGTAAKYTWKRENGDELQFNTAKFVELMNSDEKLKEEFYQQICKVWIMSYRDPDSKIIEETQTVTEEENSTPLE